MSSLELLKKHRHFQGEVCFYQHTSRSTQTPMRFSIFIPDHKSGEKLKTLYWLSGLTCTEENFITKANFGNTASKEKIMIVCPDTSPRGTQLPGEHDSYDLGSGAGFYVDAVTEPWKKHYQMYSYLSEELLSVLEANFPVDLNRIGVLGHSMGGHGALVLGLRKPEIFKSISAFSPIVAPSDCPWGQKAFTAYLGKDHALWAHYDASCLVKTSLATGTILIEQGKDDEFLEEQLKPHLFVERSKENSKLEVVLGMQDGFDHSYYFIASFIDKHLQFHSRNL